MCTHTHRWLTQPGFDEDCVLNGLSCLHAMCSHGRALERVPEDKLRGISVQLGSWLQQASRNTLIVPSSGISLFGGGAKRQVGM